LALFERDTADMLGMADMADLMSGTVDILARYRHGADISSAGAGRGLVEANR
jgi:hypothetical protein